MYKARTSILVLPILLFAAIGAQAQQFEMVHRLEYQNASNAKAALDALFEDDAMKGANATLYALDVGDADSPHLIVEDFDSYADRVDSVEKRTASHGWSKYLLGTQDAEYHGSSLIMVVDDHGKARHTAEYLAAYLIHTTDAAAYRVAVRELNDAIGNPGVLRLVAMRSGRTSVTHAVLIGGKDFAAVNTYIDKMLASDAYKAFVAKVGDTRKVVGLDMYRRIGSWGH